MSTTTIKQKSERIELGDGKSVEVRRMRWKAMRDLLKKLGATFSTLVKAQEVGPAGLVLSVEKLQDVISNSDELITHLCTASTEMTAEDFEQLDSLDASKILAAALRLNLDDELKNCWAGIVRHVQTLMPAKTK